MVLVTPQNIIGLHDPQLERINSAGTLLQGCFCSLICCKFKRNSFVSSKILGAKININELHLYVTHTCAQTQKVHPSFTS